MRGFLLTFFLLSSAISFSQNTQSQEKLTEAIRNYSELYDFSSFTIEFFGYYEEEDFDSMYVYYNKGRSLLKFVSENGTINEKKTARYFKALFNLEMSYAHTYANELQESYELLNEVKTDFDYFSSSSVFPLYYQKDNENYAIQFTDFSASLADFYVTMTELSYMNLKNEETISFARKGINFEKSTDWNKYVCASYLIRSKENLQQLDEELVNTGLFQLKLFNGFEKDSELSKQAVATQNDMLGVDAMLAAMKASPSNYSTGSVYVNVAQLAKNTNLQLSAMKIYGQMIDMGINNIAYLDEALAFFKPYAQSSDFSSIYYQLWAFTNNGTMKNTALVGADRMRSLLKTDSDCNYWLNLGSYYSYLGQNEKASEASKTYSTCQDAEAKRIKKLNRKQFQGDGDYSLYLGVYPVPMIYGNFGATAQLNLQKFSLGFAYTKVGHDRDYQPDFYNPIDGTKEYFDAFGNELDREKLYWDGSRMYGIMKFVLNDESDTRGYFMVNVGLINKTYEPFQTRVVDANNFYSVFYGPIAPTEKKYTLTLGLGAEFDLSEHWVIDLGAGLGAAKAYLDLDNPYFKDPNYLFESYMIQNALEESIGMSGYLNMSIGYKIFK